MPVDRRQLLMGGGAGVVLILALWGLWPSSPAATTTSPVRPATPARSGKVAAEPAALGPMAPVKLGSLTATREEPGEAARNPFRFQPKVAPPPARPVVVAAPPVIEAPRGPAPTPAGPPPPPAISLKLVGLLVRANGVKWAVLSDGKSPPMYGKDGDIIDGRYLIVSIGEESVEVTYTDGRGRQVIRLNGQ